MSCKFDLSPNLHIAFSNTTGALTELQPRSSSSSSSSNGLIGDNLVVEQDTEVPLWSLTLVDANGTTPSLNSNNNEQCVFSCKDDASLLWSCTDVNVTIDVTASDTSDNLVDLQLYVDNNNQNLKGKKEEDTPHTQTQLQCHQHVCRVWANLPQIAMSVYS